MAEASEPRMYGANSYPQRLSPVPEPGPLNKNALESSVAKNIASSIRKGNVIDLDGKLCVVMSAENIHPGKGTPVTHLVMRRISDGVKTEMRYKTTDTVEMAYLENRDYDYLYEDDMGFNFMQPESFEQISIGKDVIGDQAQWLQEGMRCDVRLHENNPISLELPPRVTLQIMEADPVVKGQTASSSYKPAKLSNGARIMVPPYIEAGVRVVVSTEDGTFQERAKD